VGDPVEISFSTVLDWQKIEMAVTGSAILVKDGQIPEKFSYEISGVHPVLPQELQNLARN